MKIRKGFVSNSSSSSFTCDICGEDISGYDVCLSEAEMSECVNGHIFCNDHLTESEVVVDIKVLKDFLLDLYKDDEDEIKEINSTDETRIRGWAHDDGYGEDDNDDPYDVPESKCPICSFQHIHPLESYKYLLSKLGIVEAQLLEELKGKFKNYEEMQAHIKGAK